MCGLTVQPKERPVNMEAFANRFCPEESVKNHTIFQANTSPAYESTFLGTGGNNSPMSSRNPLPSVLPQNPIARIALLLAIAAAAVFLVVVAVNGR